MANKPKFPVSAVAEQFTYEWHFFSSLIGNIPGVVAIANARRYAICFINNDTAGTVRVSTLGNLGVLGYCIKSDEQQWINIKDHGPLPQGEWTAYGTTGSERVTVIEVLQVP